MHHSLLVTTAAVCLPSAVEERHPRAATPGHGRRMEPKGRGALAIGPSLVAIITAMVKAEESRKSYSSGTTGETLRLHTIHIPGSLFQCPDMIQTITVCNVILCTEPVRNTSYLRFHI